MEKWDGVAFGHEGEHDYVVSLRGGGRAVVTGGGNGRSCDGGGHGGQLRVRVRCLSMSSGA